MRHNVEEARNAVYAHTPVMWREVLEAVESSPLKESGVLVDCTLGEGGHSEMLLERCPRLAIIAFERDPEILAIARERLGRFEGRIRYIGENFSTIGNHLDGTKEGAAFILYDLGISSYHFDKSGRGFAFAREERLDMRLSGQGLSAYEVVNGYDHKKLANIFYTLGEERWSRRIASAICGFRDKKKIETTTELADIVLHAVPRPRGGKRRHEQDIHPATRVFQAIRIHVNDELTAIRKSLMTAWRLLVPGGRIIAISFHSLEDRAVKEVFKGLAKGCTCGAYPAECACQGPAAVKILTKKPVVPQIDEIAFNKRARSAKLRVCERV